MKLFPSNSPYTQQDYEMFLLKSAANSDEVSQVIIQDAIEVLRSSWGVSDEEVRRSVNEIEKLHLAFTEIFRVKVVSMQI